MSNPESSANGFEQIDDLSHLRREVEALRLLLGGDVLDAAVAEEDWERELEREKEELEPTATAPLSAVSREDETENRRIGSSMSKARRLQAVSDALNANAKLQNRFKRLIASVTWAQDGVATIREGLREYKRRCISEVQAPRFQPCKKALGEPSGVSWFWAMPDAASPPKYPESAEVSLVASILPLTFQRAPWEASDDDQLAEAVLQRVQELRMESVLKDLEKNGNVMPTQLEECMAPIRDLKIEDRSVNDMIDTFTDEDWTTIAHRGRWIGSHHYHHHHGCLERSGMECKLRWHHAIKPGIAKGSFSAEEDAQLLKLVEQHGTHAWETIASELQVAVALHGSSAGKRTPIACLSRYQELSRQTQRVTKMSDEELQKLSELFARHGPAWKRIAEDFGGTFTEMQLLHHWRREEQRRRGGVRPRVGKWSQEENEMLMKAVALHGRKWTKVAELVPGRTDVQCRERYVNVLAPEVRNIGSFTPAEDATLRSAVAENMRGDGKVRWAAVARRLPGRTDRQVAKRWAALERTQRHRIPERNMRSKSGNNSGVIETTDGQTYDENVRRETQRMGASSIPHSTPRPCGHQTQVMNGRSDGLIDDANRTSENQSQDATEYGKRQDEDIAEDREQQQRATRRGRKVKLPKWRIDD